MEPNKLSKETVIDALKSCYDPEIQVDVWTLELIRDLKIKGDGVYIKMTFTTPACPYGPALLEDIKTKVQQAGAKKVDIELVFDPPWQPSEDLRATLGV